MITKVFCAVILHSAKMMRPFSACLFFCYFREQKHHHLDVLTARRVGSNSFTSLTLIIHLVPGKHCEKNENTSVQDSTENLPDIDLIIITASPTFIWS